MKKPLICHSSREFSNLIPKNVARRNDAQLAPPKTRLKKSLLLGNEPWSSELSAHLRERLKEGPVQIVCTTDCGAGPPPARVGVVVQPLDELHTPRPAVQRLGPCQVRHQSITVCPPPEWGRGGVQASSKLGASRQPFDPNPGILPSPPGVGKKCPDSRFKGRARDPRTVALGGIPPHWTIVGRGVPGPKPRQSLGGETSRRRPEARRHMAAPLIGPVN